MSQRLSVGIEQLLGMAAVDARFAGALLKDRAGAARAGGVELFDVERRVLDTVDDRALRQMIVNLGGAMPDADRRAFLNASAAAVVALLAGTTGCPPAPTGSRPDPPPSRVKPSTSPVETGSRPDEPPPRPPVPSTAVPSSPPAPTGSRPDLPPKPPVPSTAVPSSPPTTTGSRPDLPPEPPPPKPDAGAPKVPPRPPASRGIRPDRPRSRSRTGKNPFEE